MRYPISLPIALVAAATAALMVACMQPADEILQKSDQAGKIVFVKQASIGNNHNIAMAANPDEFYRGTDIYELSPISPSGKLTNLTAAYTRGDYNQNEWGAAEDPEISFDGKKMLFSMRKAGADHWYLYEMDLDSRAVTTLTTPLAGDDMDPAYLPDGNIVFTSTRNQIADEYERRRAPQLFLGIRQGNVIQNTRQLSFNQSHDQNPFVHSSGLVIFTRWDHLGNPNKMPLFSIHPDGTRQFVYYGADEVFSGNMTSGMRTFMEARELSDGGVVSSIMERTSAFEGGSICVIDPAKGMSAKPQIIAQTPYNFEGADITVDGIFKTPYPIMDKGKERLLVAQSAHDVGGGATGAANFDLFVMDKDGGNLQIVHLDPNYNDYDPVVVAPRTAPKVIATDPNVAAGLAAHATTGFFFDANAYDRDRSLDGQPAPAPGQLKYLRVLEAIPIPSNGNMRGGSLGETNFEKQRVVGYSDIKTDGSFAVEVPALKSLHVQTLDGNAMMVVNQLQWIHVQPGEQRVCTGCHGSREHDALITHLNVRDRDSVTYDSSATAFIARYSQAVEVSKHSAAKPDTLDFYDPAALNKGVATGRGNTVQAALDRKCASCHDAANAPSYGGGLVLQETQLTPARVSMDDNDAVSSVYVRLAGDSAYHTASGARRRLVNDDGARRSPLAWVLFNKQLDGGTGTFRTLTKDHTDLWTKDGDGNVLPFDPANADLLTLIEWMDMGIQFSNTVGSIK